MSKPAHYANVGGATDEHSLATMMDAAKKAVDLAQQRRRAVEEMRRNLLASPMPRPYHATHCPTGTVTIKAFEREFANRSSQLPEVGPPRRMAVDARSGEPAPWWPHGHGENVDVAEPSASAHADGAKGSFNARCNRHLTLDYARAEAPLASCAMTGDLAGVQFAVDAGKAVDAVDMRGNSAMALAALHGQHHAVALLVECGAQLDGTDAKGWTAAHGAAAGRHSEVLLTLYRLGAPLDTRDRSGSTPMHYAARHNDLSCLRALLVLSFDSMHVASKAGQTPLHQAALANSHLAVKLLGGIGAPSDLERVDRGGETALHYAARCAQGGADSYAELLALGADAHTPNEQGVTPHQLWRDNPCTMLPSDEARVPGVCHYSSDDKPGFKPLPGGSLEGRLQVPAGVGAADITYPNGPGAYGQPTNSKSSHAMQREKKALRNELHRMALLTQRSSLFAAREAAMAMGARAEVAEAKGHEQELVRAAKLDIPARRETRGVALREAAARVARKQVAEAKRTAKEKARLAAARKARKREARALARAQPKGYAAMLPPAARTASASAAVTEAAGRTG